MFLIVRRDVQENDEEAVRVKEQSILELGTLLAKTGQAAGIEYLFNYFTHINPKTKWLEITCFFFICWCFVSRTWWSAEICKAVSDFHQQSQSSSTGSLFARSVSWHGGSYGSGSGTVSWMHWVGQGWEEDLPTTGSGG